MLTILCSVYLLVITLLVSIWIPATTLPDNGEGNQWSLSHAFGLTLSGPLHPSVQVRLIQQQTVDTFQPQCTLVVRSTKHLTLRIESQKLASRFVGPSPISKVVAPLLVRLKLPRLMRVHPTFHENQVKPSPESSLVSASKTLPHPQIIDHWLQSSLHSTQAPGLVMSGTQSLLPGGLGRLWSVGILMGLLPGPISH